MAQAQSETGLKGWRCRAGPAWTRNS